MGTVDLEEVVGLFSSELGVVCRDCCTSQEWQSFKEDEAITKSLIEDNRMVYFCDRCKERL